MPGLRNPIMAGGLLRFDESFQPQLVPPAVTAEVHLDVLPEKTGVIDPSSPGSTGTLAQSVAVQPHPTRTLSMINGASVTLRNRKTYT